MLEVVGHTQGPQAACAMVRGNSVRGDSPNRVEEVARLKDASTPIDASGLPSVRVACDDLHGNRRQHRPNARDDDFELVRERVHVRKHQEG